MPLIAPINDKNNSSRIQDLIDSDPEFAADCEHATIQNIYAYQEIKSEHLRNELKD